MDTFPLEGYRYLFGLPTPQHSRSASGIMELRPPSERPGSIGSQALGLGTQLAAGMIFFAGLGYYADRRRGGGVFFTVCGMFAGLGYGAYEVWKLIRLINAENKEKDKSGTP